MTTRENENEAALDDADVKKEKAVPWICTARVALALIGSMGMMTLYSQRINLSVALVCMVNHTATEALYGGNTSTDDSLAPLNDTAQQQQQQETSCAANSGSDKSTKDGEFVWSKQTQGFALGAFFYGYIFTQVPGGLLAQKFGGKRVLGSCLFMASIATLLCAVAARVSPYLLIFFRVIIGLCQGVVFVSMHDLWSRWAPPLERSKLIAFTQAGAQIGNVIALPLSALLCDYGFDNGWGSIFYVFGIVGVVWCIAWMLIVSDSPSQHPRITTAEREYIATSIGTKQTHLSFRDTPWLQFAKSLPVWAIIVGHTCSNWVIYMLLTNMPAYMNEVLKFDIKANGLFSAIPYIVFWLFINIGGVTADALRKRGWKTKDVRKIIFGIGSFSGILLIALGYISCDNPYLAVAVLSVATGFCGLQFPSVLVNHVDIAPPFAAVLLGISNTAATIPGFVAPYLVKTLTPNSRQSEWQLVFYISAAIYVVGTIFYGIFADGEVQDWAKCYMISSKDQETENDEVKAMKDDVESNVKHDDH